MMEYGINPILKNTAKCQVLRSCNQTSAPQQSQHPQPNGKFADADSPMSHAKTT